MLARIDMSVEKSLLGAHDYTIVELVLFLLTLTQSFAGWHETIP